MANLLINVFDSSTLADTPTGSLNPKRISVSDLTTMGEGLTMNPNPKRVTASETTAIGESQIIGFNPTFVQAVDTTVVSDVPLVNDNQAFQIFAGGTDITRNVKVTNLSVENILNRQVDRCLFTIQSYGTRTYVPTIGNEILFYYLDNKIFGGNIVKVTQTSDIYGIVNYNVEAHDYGRRLDRYLINSTYTNMSVVDIIASIFTDKGLASEGFTQTYVSGTYIVTSISFDYQPLSSVLSALADLVNGDWYVDYDKNLHFFQVLNEFSPFNISDTDGSYLANSLQVVEDNSQVKNTVYVKGGNYLADTFTAQFISDGIQNLYNLGYQYESIRVSVTGDVFNGGIDGIDASISHDYMWNNPQQFLRFRGDRIPTNGSSIRVSGRPYLPVRIKVRSATSVTAMAASEGGSGIYEYLITDTTLNSQESARDRAYAELNAYAGTLITGQFKTYNFGLRAGQQITVNSALYGINQAFIINKVTTSLYTPTLVVCQVQLTSSKVLGIVEFFQKLLGLNNNIITGQAINPNITLDVIEAVDETVSVGDASAYSLSHNPQTESITVGETVTPQALNYGVVFVVGPLAPPSGVNRVFIIGDSYLG